MPESFQPFQQIIPLPQPQAEDILLAHQASFDFFAEVKFRAALAESYEQYQQLAAQHQRELEAMQHDINLFGWFVHRQ
jgi:hypothetical protein